MRWLCGAWVLGCALACGGAGPTATTTPVPVQEPEPDDELEPLEGYAYVPSASGPSRFSEPAPGEQQFVGVDGAKLRAPPDAEADVVQELSLAATVTAGVWRRLAGRATLVGLNCADRNIAAQRVYARLGFAPILQYEEAEIIA